MNLNINEPINRAQWLSSMKMSESLNTSMDMKLEEQLNEAEELLCKAARPRAIYRIVDIAEFNADGESIKRHLQECHKVVVLGLTLGSSVDELLRRMQIRDMAMAFIIDCGASVLVDNMADQLEHKILGRLDDGLFITSRFSPGYGDYPITRQGEIIHLLDGGRRIGLHLTADNLMVPRKSITAVIGIANHPVKGSLATCEECVIRDKCNLRKEGKYCGTKL